MNEKFEQLKHEVLQNFSAEDLFKTSVLKSPKLWDTKLYKFCEAMPKGADLHAHGGALIPVQELIKFVTGHDGLVVDTDKNHKAYVSLACKDNPSSYMPLKTALDEGLLSKEELLQDWTLAGCPSNVDIWDWFQELFEKHNDLNEIGPTCKDYFQFAFEYYAKTNINHVEMRLFLKGSEEDAFNKAHCAFDAYVDAKKKYPQLSVKVIPVGLKAPSIDMSVTENIYKNTALMNKKIKDGSNDFVVGLDLVNEEDTSRSIKDFEELIKKTLADAPNLKVNLHAGETTKESNNEIAEAIKLGSRRIGHGLNLWAHPELKQTIKENNICLEVCPVSNQSLGFCDDLREHPAKQYCEESIPMVLCSDDATYQEHSTLSDDYFYSILAWDLKLNDVEKLIENSIKYSYSDEKDKLLRDWKDSWTTFLRDF